jgi:hypothetical protein
VFSKVAETYKLVHFYRVVTIEDKTGPLAMEGYDMQRQDTAKAISDSLRSAYAPATLKVWTQEELASESEVLQFEDGADPVSLGLHGEWVLLP